MMANKEFKVKTTGEESPSTEAMSVDEEGLLKSECESLSTIIGSQSPEPEMAEGSKNPEAEKSADNTSYRSHS